MRARNQGWIINITTVGGTVATPLGGWYHATKFALERGSDSLRLEVRQFGIDVVVIKPGGVQSEWSGIAANDAERLSGRGSYAWMVARPRAFQWGGIRMRRLARVVTSRTGQSARRPPLARLADR